MRRAAARPGEPRLHPHARRCGAQHGRRPSRHSMNLSDDVRRDRERRLLNQRRESRNYADARAAGGHRPLPPARQSTSRTRRRPRCSSHVEREGRHDRDRASKDMARTVGADPWRAAIERTLERSEVLVVLVSGASMASAEVRYELNRYRRRWRGRGRRSARQIPRAADPQPGRGLARRDLARAAGAGLRGTGAGSPLDDRRLRRSVP
jgi:hypothetical protein